MVRDDGFSSVEVCRHVQNHLKVLALGWTESTPQSDPKPPPIWPVSLQQNPDRRESSILTVRINHHSTWTV